MKYIQDDGVFFIYRCSSSEHQGYHIHHYTHIAIVQITAPALINARLEVIINSLDLNSVLSLNTSSAIIIILNNNKLSPKS